ncbi:LDLR chaperone MESD-like [Acanthaster planci]|uniref:LDLR chaperone MESD-like n=1 Tax=Acanthaster planci TaxID=133434 RepID=A0A8B7ZIT8_ACAPL|nr:LDLR chaperone MESD-like [Acanthaster planci]
MCTKVVVCGPMREQNTMTANRRLLILPLLVAFLLLSCLGVDSGQTDGDQDIKQDTKPKKKKDIRDYNDADMERLFMEWEEHEDEHDPDDLLEHERPPPKVDLSQIDPSNPESAIKLTKKGKTLMMFVTVAGNPTEEESEKITNRWQSMLFNANYQFKRYPVSSNRAIFLLSDGSLAWEIKDFLIQQDECEEVTIESQVYYGKGSGKEVDGKAKIVGLDDVGDGKPDKKKKSQPKAAKQKTKSKASSGKPDDSKQDSKKDRTRTVEPTKDKSEENATGKTSKRDSKESKKEDKILSEDVEKDKDGIFFQQNDEDTGDKELGDPTDKASAEKDKQKEEL